MKGLFIDQLVPLDSCTWTMSYDGMKNVCDRNACDLGMFACGL